MSILRINLAKPTQDTAGVIACLAIAATLLLFFLAWALRETYRYGAGLIARDVPPIVWLSRGWLHLLRRLRRVTGRGRAWWLGGRAHQPDHEMAHPSALFDDAGPAGARSLYDHLPRYEDVQPVVAPRMPPPAYGSWDRPGPNGPRPTFAESAADGFQQGQSEVRLRARMLSLHSFEYSGLASRPRPEEESAMRHFFLDGGRRRGHGRQHHDATTHARDVDRGAPVRRSWPASHNDYSSYRGSPMFF